MTTGASVAPRNGPPFRPRNWGGPLRLTVVISLSPHTNKGPPEGSPCDHPRPTRRYRTSASSQGTSFNKWFGLGPPLPKSWEGNARRIRKLLVGVIGTVVAVSLIGLGVGACFTESATAAQHVSTGYHGLQISLDGKTRW